MQRLTTSAALYFHHQPGAAVPLEWFEMACCFLKDYDLPVTYFIAPGTEFPGDDVYGFTAHKLHLIEALKMRVIDELSLGSIRDDAEDAEDWRGAATLDLRNGLLYLGVEEGIIPCPASLLYHAYNISKVGLSIRYGIGYKSLLTEAPLMYAIGARAYTLSDVRRELQLGHERKDCLDAWRDEMRAERRYLTGRFRGAYPACILSESHIEAASLRACSIGKLSSLDSSLWLWELSECEIPVAEQYLAEKDVLIVGKYRNLS